MQFIVDKMKGMPAIPGLIFCCFRGEEDLPKIAAVINASFAADYNGERVTVEGLRATYAHPVHWDPLQDTLLVEVNGELVGCATTEWRTDADGNCLHAINLYLTAAWRGRGLEPAMQNHMEGCARTAAAAGPGVAHWYSSTVPATWQAAIEMLPRLGYAPVRHYFEMRRPLAGENLPVLALPAGLTLRPAAPEHYRAIWEAGVECFRDQQDYVASGEEDYRAWAAAPDLDASLWVVAWDGDRVAGAAINVLHDGGWGETDDLYVRRPWRKRGLGRALLAASLHLFKVRGLTTAGLGVDAGNASGALRLYKSVGYRPYQRLVAYRKQM